MTSTTNIPSQATSRLYQANLTDRDEPMMVAAYSPRDALERAIDIWGAPRAGILIVEVTAQWEELSERIRNHTRKLLLSGEVGIVDYDEEQGWQIIDPLACDR